MLELEEMDWKT